MIHSTWDSNRSIEVVKKPSSRCVAVAQPRLALAPTSPNPINAITELAMSKTTWPNFMAITLSVLALTHDAPVENDAPESHVPSSAEFAQ